MQALQAITSTLMFTAISSQIDDEQQNIIVHASRHEAGSSVKGIHAPDETA